jgi:hypothetical protein
MVQILIKTFINGRLNINIQSESNINIKQNSQSYLLDHLQINMSLLGRFALREKYDSKTPTPFQ